jgi:hypothetical protein
LLQRYRKGEYYIEIDLDDVRGFDDMLQEQLQKNPNEYLALVLVPFVCGVLLSPF